MTLCIEDPKQLTESPIIKANTQIQHSSRIQDQHTHTQNSDISIQWQLKIH